MKINNPYNYEEIENNAIFQFSTINGIAYRINFSPLDFAFNSLSLLNSCAFELSIELVTKTSVRIQDRKIESTIIAIIKEFFLRNPSNFIIFHVANYDNKSVSRMKLFNRWFDNSNDNFIEKFDKNIVEEEKIFYISLLLRKDNPLKTTILESFNQWIDDTNSTK